MQNHSVCGKENENESKQAEMRVKVGKITEKVVE
jgi:hypothetical protein